MAAWCKSEKMGIKLMSRAVDFLQTASGATVGAYMLRVMDAQSTLLPISSLPDDELHTANVALICLINIMGNQEAHKKGQDSPIMIMRPDVLGDAKIFTKNIILYNILCTTNQNPRWENALVKQIRYVRPKRATWDYACPNIKCARVPNLNEPQI